ncbi:uncharacterized protein PD653_4055, partial [Nocardioides sp. PD653]
MRAHEGPGRRDADESLIHVAVDRHRNLADPTGVRVHRVSHFEERAQWNVGPPRMRYDDTVLDLAVAEGTCSVLEHGELDRRHRSGAQSAVAR